MRIFSSSRGINCRICSKHRVESEDKKAYDNATSGRADDTLETTICEVSVEGDINDAPNELCNEERNDKAWDGGGEWYMEPHLSALLPLRYHNDFGPTNAHLPVRMYHPGEFENTSAKT